MADSTSMLKNRVQEVGDSCAQAAKSAADGAKNMANYVSDQAQEAVNAASKQASSAGHFMDRKAEEATSAIGGGLKSAGESIRQYGPHDGRLGQASSAVARQFTDSGNYVERAGMHGIAADMTNLIKRNPLTSVAIGVGLGILFARASTSRK